jgi:NodT family efflux transporter outer membrane factor (OMF) lipoprotein
MRFDWRERLRRVRNLRRVRALCVSALLPAALGGCVLDQETARPDIAAAARFDGADRNGAPAPRDWLARFGSTELKNLGALADSQNLDIKAAVARIEQAEAQARFAAAVLYPTLDGGAGASQTYTPGPARGFDPPFRSTHAPLYGLNFTASYQLDFWGRNHDTIEAALLTAQAARYDRDVIALSTDAAVATLYFQLLEAQDRLAVAKNNVSLATEVLKAIQGRKSVGTASVLDEAQQATVVAQQRATVPPLEQAVVQSRNSLAVLLGQTPEATHIHGGSLKTLRAPAIRAGLPAQLLRRRPDIAEAEAKFAAQGFSVDAARAAFLPSISLSGDSGLASQTLKNLLTPQGLAYSLAASVTQPIFDGGALRGQLDAQKGLYRELLEQYRKQILTAFADVENGLIALRKTGETLRLQGEAVAASRRGYEAATLLLKGGTIDIVTLATTENAYFQALNAEVQARAAYYQAATTLYQALGGGWEQDERLAAAN